MKNILITGLFLFCISFTGIASSIYKKSSIENDIGLVAVRKDKRQLMSKSFKELTGIIDQYAATILAKGNINSLTIGIYRNGEVYTQYYGVLDSVSKQKVSDNTLFEIASISKTFTGSLVAKAVLEHKISLTDDIRKYLKGSYTNLQYEGIPITIQNLLTHTLGFKDKAPEKLALIYQGVREGKYENKSFDYGMSDLLEELKTVELNKKPGTLYEYNSVGPELLAYVLEQVYHKPYKELVQGFLDDLNLSNTHLYEYDKYKKQLAVSFDENGKVAPLLKNPLLGGSHGMISNLPDLIKFMRFQLESDDPIIKESTRLLFKDEVEGDDKGYLWDVGYGQKEGAYHGKTGTSNGVQSGILICPDSCYGMIVIMNNNSEAAQDDWGLLYNQIETELIMYPKINQVSLLSTEFK